MLKVKSSSFIDVETFEPFDIECSEITYNKLTGKVRFLDEMGGSILTDTGVKSPEKIYSIYQNGELMDWEEVIS